MRYLFIIDHEHLDNGGFLKLLSKNLAGLRLENFMLLHGDSAHTERIIQTGVMREQATIRSVKELNHRLTALFADEGIPLIAMNGFQRNTICQPAGREGPEINAAYLKKLGGQTHLLLSNLVQGPEGPRPMPLALLAEALQQAIHFDYIIAFDASEDPNEIFASSGQANGSDLAVRPKELKSSNLNISLLKMRHTNTKAAFEEAIRA